MKVFWLMLITAFIGTTAFGQCTKLTDHPKGADFAKRQFVYRDQVKAKKYEAAMPQWRDLYTHCRAGNGYILRDGETIYKYFSEKAEKAGDKNQMKLHMDTVGLMMTQRIECYGKKTRKSTGLKYAGYRYYLLGKHYINSATKFDAEDDKEKSVVFEYYQNAMSAFESSIKADGNKVEANLVHLYAFVAIELWKANSDDKEYIKVEQMRDLYEQLLKIADDNSDKVDFIEAGDKVKAYYSSHERTIFDCAFFLVKVKPDFYKNYDDPVFIKDNVRNRLVTGGCDEDEPFYVLVRERYLFLVDSLEEDSRDLIDKGNICLRDGDEACALNYFEKGITDATIASDKRYKAAMRSAGLYQRDEKWSKSLEYYNKAIELNPNTGDPYIKLGMLYLRANRTCAGFERQKVASISIDFFNKAAGYSDSATEGKNKASEYRQYLPTTEQVFQRGMKPGQATTAGCVLKRSTTLRSRD